MSTKPGRHTLAAYVLKEYALAFLISFLFFFFIFFVNQILLIARNILLRNISFVSMLKILLYSIPIILAYTFPFASLTGATMSLGDLSTKNEILAMRTTGISYRQILAPILIFALGLTSISFVLNDVFLPLGTIRYKSLYKELLYASPTLELDSYAISRFGDLIFVNGEVSQSSVDQILIIDTGSRQIGTTTASRAELSAQEQDQAISLKMHQAISLTPRGNARGELDLFSSSVMQLFLHLNEVSLNLLSVSPNEKSIRDLLADVRIKQEDLNRRSQALSIEQEHAAYSSIEDYYNQGISDSHENRSFDEYERRMETVIFSRTLQYYLLELYKKTALPFACILLVLFAFPFSMMQLKNGRLVGFSVGIITSVVYWFAMFAGQSLGLQSSFSPFLIMWGPNLLLVSIGVVMYLVRSRT